MKLPDINNIFNNPNSFKRLLVVLVVITVVLFVAYSAFIKPRTIKDTSLYTVTYDPISKNYAVILKDNYTAATIDEAEQVVKANGGSINLDNLRAGVLTGKSSDHDDIAKQLNLDQVIQQQQQQHESTNGPESPPRLD